MNAGLATVHVYYNRLELFNGKKYLARRRNEPSKTVAEICSPYSSRGNRGQ
jgi:hypothetical protein